MKLKLPEQVNTAIEKITKAGFEAFAVGGCVRDMIMGKMPSDFDVTTSATPDEVKNIFFDYHVIETGVKHGTLTVNINHMSIEITTYRIDNGYSDGRHPDKVEFTENLKMDLARRDFTVNAMAYNDKLGIIDCYGGMSDIDKGMIRAVGNPFDRFSEDALRILRAIRFASVLDFDIDERTDEAMREKSVTLQNISKERIAAELTKLLCGTGAGKVICRYVDIIGAVIPEVLKMKGFDQRNPHHCYDLLTHTAVAVNNIDEVPFLRWTMLLHDIGKPETFSVDNEGIGHFYRHGQLSEKISGQILNRLKFDNETIQLVITLVKYHDVQIEMKAKNIKRLLNKLGVDVFFDLLKVKRADNMAQAVKFHGKQEFYHLIEIKANEIIEAGECFTLKDLDINGNDIINMGISEGKEIGVVLRFLLESVIEGKIENEKDNLMKYYMNYIKTNRINY